MPGSTSNPKAPPTASASALARARARQASLDAANRPHGGSHNSFMRVGPQRAGDGGPVHSGMYDAEDDPDRLYFARGLGRLDSDEDSGDNESVGVNDHDDDWGDDENVYADDADGAGDLDEPTSFNQRPTHIAPSSYVRPEVFYNVGMRTTSPTTSHNGFTEDEQEEEEEEEGPEASARFEWQHMLSNVLQGDVLKSEKTRLSTATLSTTQLANSFEFVTGSHINKRQRAYAIWLLLRAKVRGRSPEEESRYIEEARSKVDDILNEVSKFKVSDLVPNDNGPALDDSIRQRNAAVQVAGLLDRVDWCESLYPSTHSLMQDKEKVRDPDVISRLEALRTWQQITRRLEVTIGILKKWTGSDWEALSTHPEGKVTTPGSEDDDTIHEGTVAGGGSSDSIPRAHPTLAFVETIVREDTLQVTFQKQLLSNLHALVQTAKTAMIDLSPTFQSMNLPPFSSDLLRLALFPSRLAQEALRTRLNSVVNIHDPSVVLIDQLTEGLRKILQTACQIKLQYLEIAEPDVDSGWSLPTRVEDYEETLLAALRFFFKLLHWKLKSPSKAIYLKETEIVEGEWGFLSDVTETIEGGDILVGEHFATLTHRLLLRVSSYFETQLQVLETRDMTLQEMLRWFGQTLDNVRQRHRKLLRFSKSMLQRFENSAEYHLDNIDLAAFITGLIDSDHFMIYTGTFEREGIYMIGDPSLHERPQLVRHILARCFSNSTQTQHKGKKVEVPTMAMLDGEEDDDLMHYVLLLSPREPFMWTGRVMNLELPKLAFDLREKRVRVVSDGPGVRLARSKMMFLDLFPTFRRNVLIEQKAHLARVSTEIKKIGRATFRLAETILGSVDRVKAVSGRTPGQGQELVGNYFSFAADLGQRSIKHLESSSRTRYVLMLMKFAISWIAFICDDCIPTDPKTFKWAVNALEFAMSITRGDNILKFDEDEFGLLRSKVASCMTLLISHFDILGARSSHEAKKEQERIDAARLEMKTLLALKLEALNAKGHSLEGATMVKETGAFSSVGSLQLAWDRRMDALQQLEESRQDVESNNRMVGRVLDQEKAEDRSLAFLASSSSNISMRWQQGKFIGGGTFGSVYLAVNLDSGEELAVKEIRFQDLTSAPHLIKTIRDEMKVMEMLRHENIVEYYGIEVHRDKVYIFEEYCQGGSLANLLEHGRIEDEIVIQIYAAQMLSGLIYLHSENVVHRDIKPDNILLDANGTIKYVDFGAAKVLAKNQKTLAGRSRLGAPVGGPEGVAAGADANSLTGTPMYLSPETVKGERRGKLGAMDVWSLGCVILECATGRRPWSNLDNEWSIMFHIGIAVQHPPLPDPSQLSELGIDFIRQCLTIDPDQRPTALELMSHPWIEQFKDDLDTANYEESGTDSSSWGSTPPTSATGSLRTNGSGSLGFGGQATTLIEEEEEEEEDVEHRAIEEAEDEEAGLDIVEE